MPLYLLDLSKAFYKLHKRIEFQGLKISIENRKGSIRSGVDKDGHEWRTKMACDYGYIRMSKTVRRRGSDKEGLDVFVGPDQNSDQVFIVHLMRANNPAKFDEDKVFLGFASREDAKAMFDRCYDKAGQKLYGGMVAMNMEAFKRRLGVQSESMIKTLLHVLKLDLFKAKTHVKAHFRRDASGKLIFIKDFDATRHHADHIIEAGKTYKINNPRSQHHGKHATVTGYMPESDKKGHYVMAMVDGKRSDLKPEHFEHLDGGLVTRTPVIRRTPVKKPDAPIDPPATTAVAPADSPVTPPAEPTGKPTLGKRPDAPFVLDAKDVLSNEYHFQELLDKFLEKNPDITVKMEDSGKDLRYNFTIESAGTKRSAGYIQVSTGAKRPHRVVFGYGSKNLSIAEFYKDLCKAWRKENGGTLDIKGAFGDIGIKINKEKDGAITLTGSTFSFRDILSKFADWQKGTTDYKMKDPEKLVELLEALPPFYTKEELDDEKDRGRDGIDPTGSGTADSSADPHRDVKGDFGTSDGRGDSSGSAGGASGTSAADGAAKDKKLKTYNIKELVEIIHKRGVKAPDPHIKLDSKVIKDLTLYDHQIVGAESIVSAFDKGAKGFLLGDDVGTGKTFTATAVIAQMKPKRTLICVPNDGVRNQWIEVLKKAGITATAAEGTKKDYSLHTGVLICTDATLAENPTLHDTPNDLFMIDEAHRMKNLAESAKTSDRAEAAYNLVQVQMSSGGKTLYMSATPYERPWQAQIYEALEMWPPGGFDAWVNKHGVNTAISKSRDAAGNVVEKRAYSLVGNGKMAVKRTLMSHIRNIAAGKFLAREVQPEGVTLSNHFHKIDLDPETKKQYAHVMEFFDTAIKRAGSSKNAFFLGGQRVLWARRFMEAAKLPAVIAAAKSELFAGRKVAIMCGYKHAADINTFIDKVSTKLGHMSPGALAAFKDTLKALGEKIHGTFDALEKEFPNAAFYHGEMTSAAKEAAKTSYNYGKANVLIATQAAADTGLSLHDTIGSSPRSQINLSLPWSAIQMKQLSGRSHRLGTKSDTRMHWLFADDSSEKERAVLVSKKMEIMGASSAGIDVTDSDDLYQRLVDFDMADGTGVEYKGSRPKKMKKSIGFQHVIAIKKI